jgi:hypothetical protein
LEHTSLALRQAQDSRGMVLAILSVFGFLRSTSAKTKYKKKESTA